MTKLIILAGIAIALAGFFLGGFGFFVPAPVREVIKISSGIGSNYGIQTGMNSDDAQRKLLSQGFYEIAGKSVFTDGNATKYFQKGNVLISIKWEHDISPMNSPGIVSNITLVENVQNKRN
jgi:hypothetical protein